MAAVIEVEELTKRYGDATAVDHVSFEVAEGEVFGVLGPNGACKTTTVECLQWWPARSPSGWPVRCDPAASLASERVG